MTAGRALVRRFVVLGGAAVGLALTLGAACETVNGRAIAAYIDELDALRTSASGEDERLGERFARLVASESRDAAAYLALYRELHASNTELLAALEEIVPPSGVRRHHRDFVEGLRDLVTALDEVTALIEAGEVIEANRQFQRAVTRSQAKQAGAMLQIRRVARSVGIRN